MRAVKQSKNDDLPHTLPLLWMETADRAQQRGLPRQAGHEQGSKAAEDIVRYANELGIKHITLYAFSRRKLASSTR